MFKHILVPTDLTDSTFEALNIAVKMALHEQSQVTLLHIIETIADAQFEEFEDFYLKLKRRAQKKMELMLDRYQQELLSINREITYGKRVNEIVKFADQNAIDLIVLTSHRIEVTESSKGWGTISYKVGILSPCPVMLVK